MGLFQALYSVPLIMYVCFYNNSTLFDYYSFATCFEILSVIPSALFFLWIALAILETFVVLYKFQDCLFYFCEENAFVILIEIALNLYFALDSMAILKTFFQFMNTADLYIYLCLQFPSSVSQFLTYTSFTTLIKFIPKFFYYF